LAKCGNGFVFLFIILYDICNFLHKGKNMSKRLFRVLVLFETSQQVLRGIAHYNRLHGPWEFYHQQPYYREQLSWQRQLERMRQFKPHGIIAHMHTEKQAKQLLNKVAYNKPAVISLHSGKSMDGVKCIVTDDKRIAQIGAEHFLERGFHNFAYCGWDDIHWSMLRLEMYAEYLHQIGHSVNLYQYPKTLRQRLWENEQILVAQWIKALPKPVGILSCNDDRGREVLEACRLAEVKVPEEVAVLGVGDHDIICDMFEPTLSSVDADRQQAGFESAKALDAMMKGQTVKLDNILIRSHSVKARRSTDIMAVEDEQVAEALMYIRSNFKKLIQVSDVVKYVAVSRRGLERRFRKYLNRSIHDEIRRVQIEYICLLLRESRMSMSQIAAQMGHMELDSLSRMFRKEMGISPRAYRKSIMEYIPTNNR
jgi:LacI family transcriptional regulator